MRKSKWKLVLDKIPYHPTKKHHPFRYLPQKCTWGELGVEVIAVKDIYPLLAISDEDAETSPGYVSLEPEFTFGPTGDQCRSINRFFKKCHLTDGIQNTLQMLTIIQHHILGNTSPLIVQKPHMEADGLETPFPPATLAAHKQLADEYEKIISVFHSYGFTDKTGKDGIHAGMDLTLFGEDDSKKRKSLANFLWFLWNEKDFMLKFSGRENGTYDYQADLYALLGDRFGNLSENELKQIFIAEKNILLDAADECLFKQSLNIRIRADGRYLEFRWFGSKQNVNFFMKIVEFCYSITELSRHVDNPRYMSLETYHQFLQGNSDRFPKMLAYVDMQLLHEKVH